VKRFRRRSKKRKKKRRYNRRDSISRYRSRLIKKVRPIKKFKKADFTRLSSKIKLEAVKKLIKKLADRSKKVESMQILLSKIHSTDEDCNNEKRFLTKTLKKLKKLSISLKKNLKKLRIFVRVVTFTKNVCIEE